MSTAIETALQNWVEAATGLDDAHVIFSDQDGPRPDDSYITIRLGDSIPLGAFDYLDSRLVDEGEPSEALEVRAIGNREMTVSIQAFTPDTLGNSAARALLSRVRSSVSLPTPNAALRAAGLSIFDAGTVRNLSALRDTDFRGRALLEVRLYFVETATERISFIESADITDTDTGETFEVDLNP